MKNIPIGDDAPQVVNVIIEILAGDKNKYEYSEELDTIVLDRVLYSTLVYPTDYGLIPGTRSEDGDHLDALMVMQPSTFRGCVVAGRPIGVLKMVDAGEHDEKIICVPAKDVRFDHVKEVADLGPHFKDEIEFFFAHYKDLQHKTVTLEGWGDAAAARAQIETAVKLEVEGK